MLYRGYVLDVGVLLVVYKPSTHFDFFLRTVFSSLIIFQKGVGNKGICYVGVM